jgi:NAD(P)H-dependent flavin oxidoreductase YrpB (nitropropane dioxygenase family)
MSEIDRPWIAYKVLAAGAIHPRAGFRYAFRNGADFALVGMFDFQVAENVETAARVLSENLDRQRDWMA